MRKRCTDFECESNTERPVRSYEYSKEMADGGRRGDGFDSRQGQKSEAMRKIIIIRRVLAQAFGVVGGILI